MSMIIALCALTFTAEAVAAPKKAPAAGPAACNFRSLPLATDNTWTYRSGAQTVIIKVTDVSQGKDSAGKPATVVTLEEQFQGRTVQSTITCTPTGGLIVAMESFFYSGEPGGPVSSTIAITDRDKVTYMPDDQIVVGNGWIEVVKAEVARVDTGGAGAVHAPATIEVERHVNVKAEEPVMIGLGSFKPLKLVFELRGRGTVEDQKSEIPIRRPGVIYVVKGVGFVKVDDAFDKTWELTETNLVSE
jgi:hypothetical protein